jgi:hypothetical protein
MDVIAWFFCPSARSTEEGIFVGGFCDRFDTRIQYVYAELLHEACAGIHGDHHGAALLSKRQ